VRITLLISALALPLTLCAADKPVATFTENRGQWPGKVLYRSQFPGGALFVEKNAFTYLLYQGGPLAHHGHDPSEPVEPFKAHAYRVSFEGSQPAAGEGRNVQAQYENFFLGKDASHWGTHCGVFGKVVQGQDVSEAINALAGPGDGPPTKPATITTVTITET